MRIQNFSADPLDEKLDHWLEKFLGNEVFQPDSSRLEKYFKTFKDGFKEKKISILTIGGTNGKGEVCLYLEEMFLQKNYQTYLWSSPHVITVRERFSLSGAPISGQRLLSLFEKNKDLTKILSYYEFLFFIFCQVVSEDSQILKGPQVIIFEVGLGGRLDATNYFDPDLTATTSIGRDHMEILGPTLKDVLREKLGITRRGVKHFACLERQVLISECKKHCDKNEVPLELLKFSAETPFQMRNWQLAQKLIGAYFGEPVYELKKPEKVWARPFEVTYEGQQFTLIGSHNLDGLRSLAHWANAKKGQGPSYFDEIWVGMSRKEDIEIDQCLELIDQSSCLAPFVRFFEFNHPRATPLARLKKSWLKGDRKKKANFETDFKTLSFQANKKILICGSYYFLGSLLHDRRFSCGLYCNS